MPLDPRPPSEFILDHRIDIVPIDDAFALIRDKLEGAPGNGPLTTAFLNATSIDHGLRQPEVFSALADLDLALPDSVSIVLASRIMGGRIRFRYSGIDMLRLCLNIEGKSHFFFGAQQNTLERIQARIGRDFPKASYAGHFSPPMWPWNSSIDNEVLQQIEEAKPDFLWVGLSAPKQELWLAQNRDRIAAPAALAVGYAFDTLAETRKLAPAWVRRAGLEWAYRLLQDPRRIWRRALVQNPLFLLRIIGRKIQSQ